MRELCGHFILFVHSDLLPATALSLTHTHTHLPASVLRQVVHMEGNRTDLLGEKLASTKRFVAHPPAVLTRCRLVATAMTKNNCAKMYILLTRLVCPCSHLSSRGAPQEPDGALDRQRGQVVLVRLLVLVRKAGGSQLHLTGMLVGWCFVATERARASTRRMPWLSLSSRAFACQHRTPLNTRAPSTRAC